MPSAARSETFQDLIHAMKRAAGALREADVPFMLGGGLAAWARGGPSTDHDVDFYVREEDVERGAEALAAAGMRIETPPEGWLVKAWDGETLVDLIYHPSGGPITDEHFARAEECEVMAVRMQVASLEDVMATKLLALSEQEPDFSSVLTFARTLRERIDWDEVRERTVDHPFAKAFFTLVEELGIVAPARA